MLWVYLALPGALLWLTILLLPWRPWRVREALEATHASSNVELDDVTVLIPARNEAETIAAVLHGLNSQGRGLKTVLVDDQSTDATVEIARTAATHELLVIAGQSLPGGWTGKLWALHQGRAYLERPLTLLLDADIELAPGMIATLRRKMQQDGLRLVSLMAALRMQSFWEKLLLPAFIFFFRLLYPFHLSNDPTQRRVAAAAGGCILLETRLIDEIGGFAALRGALIDDCTLARRVKSLGARTWVGLTHSVRSLRRYDRLEGIWNMVARSAFTQLGYSTAALLGCTVLFVAAFWLPIAGLFLGDGLARVLAALGLLAMMVAYLPTLRFYGLAGAWGLALPLIGTLYLAMTWGSAWRYWHGQRSRWKGRAYGKTLDSGSSG
jgi:hopene-associated glycosyltransferase HpnB